MGHRDDKVDFSEELSTNRGNFMALLELQAKADKVLKQHLETAKKNAKYTSKTIQEDIIKTVGQMLREKITEPLRTGRVPFFAVIADEVTDKHANQEILCVCIRYVVDASQVGSVTIKEELLDFAHLTRTTGEAVGKSILELLQAANLNCSWLEVKHMMELHQCLQHVLVHKPLLSRLPIRMHTMCTVIHTFSVSPLDPHATSKSSGISLV